ncbi:deoxyribodipyrimidine photo-lyase [Terasakiella sp. A23]|uniref:cryptochrome/photolyase family protein n=1 Tax=Terasakiella sp. FCG-A23 TaxID=3080561 RepID=UPI002954281E|nr:deoxyribodipyrimidine photo-lyase [Terasakiella sp. A23]MDV7340261.1 deoxyribodipyrimidine photo-lyase [Terasakiella sp. A23]
MPNNPTIMWFRQDLRIQDNPALAHAAQSGPFLPIYILDDKNAADWQMGGAGRLWLQHALNDLNTSLKGNLQVFIGDAFEILKSLKPKEIHWNRCYEPWRIKRDKDIKSYFQDKEVTVTSHNGSLLWEPWEIAKKDGTPYKVFTPYYRKGCLGAPPPRPEIDTQKLPLEQRDIKPIEILNDKRDWTQTTIQNWDITEKGAHNRLNDFLETSLHNYKNGRDFPALETVSRLSPYLHFGQISPHQVWHHARGFAALHQVDQHIDHFCSELAWREFSYSLLFYQPNLPTENLNAKFNPFTWSEDEESFDAWCLGRTGYPLVDAGMRELWQTGFMHNRVRMVTASFLIKNLMIDWRKGENWFWDCLFDADLANNAASWQWVAGCGADAAPYFRIFNPVTQSKKFDPDGTYIRKYIPELRHLSNKDIHEPWKSKQGLNGYPAPIIDLKFSRERALAAYKNL